MHLMLEPVNQAKPAPLRLCPSVPLLVLAGLFTFFTCIFVIFFHTRYRRLEAEEQAIYRNQRSGGSGDLMASEQTVSTEVRNAS